MALAARIIFVVYALGSLAVAVLFGGIVWLFMTGDMKAGVGQMILLAIPFNIAFAILAYAERFKPGGILIMALGPLYAVAGLLLMRSWGFLEPASDMNFIWPGYPVKAVVAVIAGFILYRDARAKPLSSASAGNEG